MKTLKVLGIASVLLSPFALLGQSFSFFEDFQSLTPGEAPNASGYPSGVTFSSELGSSSQIYVVGSSTTPADPFGTSGNQSLMIHRANSDPANSGGIPRATFHTPQKLTTGDISYKLLIANNGTGVSSSTVDLFLGSGSGVGGANYAVRISVSKNTLRVTDGSATQLNAPSMYDIAFDTAVTLKVSFTESSYSLYLNDLLVTIGGKSSFDFITGRSGEIDYVQFASGWNANTNTRFYVDDLSITSQIPEASTVGLVLGAATLALVLWKRKSAVRG